MPVSQAVNCRVFLLGCLQEKPNLMMDSKGDYVATIVVSRDAEHNTDYRVFIYGQSALRIRQYGFVGLALWIEGDFKNNGEILAEKVEFLDFSKSGDENRCVV